MNIGNETFLSHLKSSHLVSFHLSFASDVQVAVIEQGAVAWMT